MESHTDESRPTATSGARAEVPAEASPTVRCILVTPESQPQPPADLVEAFVARQLDVRECVGVFEGMAALLRSSKQEHQPIALVVVEPDAFAANRARDLMRSAHRYVERAARWVYDHRLSPRLQKWDDTDVSPPKVNGIREAIQRAEDKPALRLTGFPDELKDAEAPPADDEDRGSILTEEELAMLLGTDDETRPNDRDAGNPPHAAEPEPPRPPYDPSTE